MLVTTQRTSGLLLAERAAVPDGIRRELKRLDPDLVLDLRIDEHHQAACWHVLRRVGYDRPAVWLFAWREDPDDAASRPLPLTSRIVDEAAARRLGSRRPETDPVAENDRAKERLRAEAVEAYTYDIGQGVRRAKRGRTLPRSVGLRMARDKARARGEKQ